MTMRIKLVVAVLVVVTLTARLLPGARTIDDAYITYRYARNLLAGEGFVYNAGERIQGTTTPLYTLLLAGLGALTGGVNAPFPLLSLGVNALADCGTAVVLFWLGRRLGSPRAGLAAGLAWAVAPFSVTFAIGGLETSVYVLLLNGCAAAFLVRRRGLTALLAGLALLTRPDALILIGPLGLQRGYAALRPKDGRDQLRWTEFAALLPVLGWFVFATLYFGSPVAHSVQAKLNAYQLGQEEALTRLIQHYATPFMEQNWFGTGWIGVGLVVYPFLYVVGARRALRREPRLLVWLAYPWLYFATFALTNPLIFRWYLTPPLPGYFLVILLGAGELLGAAVDGLLRKRGGLGRLGLLLAVIPALLLLRDWRLRAEHGAARPAPQMAYIELELLYRQAAEVVSPYLAANSRLAAGDVGVLGYFTPARILDTVGLNSAEALAYYPLDARYYIINYAVAPDLIIEQQPDAVTILEVYGRAGLLQDARFARDYRLLHKIETDMYGSDGLLIFLKR